MSDEEKTIENKIFNANELFEIFEKEIINLIESFLRNRFN